jgi:SM-20-related protein
VGIEIERAAREPLDAAGLCAALFADGVAVQNHFLALPRVRELVECAEMRRARGDFAAARIGADARLKRREEIRGDSTCWLAEPMFAGERALLDDLDQLRLELNREGYLGLFDLEVHYAWYPPGAGYARHVDQLQGRDQRKLSIVLYLNERWPPEAGGELRIFGQDGARDIGPIAGRLVCFLTAGREHEVLPTRQGRWSITGWFRQRVQA